MKLVFEVLRHPLVLGALALSILIVVGAYFGSRWYYSSDVEPIDIPDNSTLTPRLPEADQVAKVNLEGVKTESEKTPIESAATPVTGVASESVDDVLAALSDEELELLMAEVEEDQPTSPFGFGPFPDVPSDFPDTPIWEEDHYPEGDNVFGSDFMRELELLERVLIKLWSQGHRVSSGSTHKGLVLPHYPNTVYVEWSYLAEPDGTMTRYVSGVTSGPDVPVSVHDSIMDEEIIPSGITVLDPDSDGIDPYTFLNLNP
ncbi:MAG: hypothetical protein OXN17_18655 [Candidatus Poribacteria bacterium]|nr:hypothetical protein [Candidatus Poribacteria bacterium]MDE0505821.1 hypothetical protein [Candidatus Poribacteria bacterium]